MPIPVTLLLLRFSPTAFAAKPVAWIGLGSAALLTGLMVILSAPSFQSAFTLYQLSWIQVLPLFAALVLVTLAYYRLKVFIVCAAALTLAVPLIFWSFPALLASLANAIQVAAGNDLSYLLARESAPLLSDRGFFALSGAISMYTPLILLFPVLLLLFVWKSFHERPISSARALASIFAILGGVLLFLQNRFGEYAAPAVALIIAWAIVSGGSVSAAVRA